METFDFRTHLDKIKNAKDEVEKILIQRDQFLYYDSLPKNEQTKYKGQLSNFVREEGNKIKEELEKIRQMPEQGKTSYLTNK